MIKLNITQAGVNYLKTTKDNHSATVKLKQAKPTFEVENGTIELKWLLQRGYAEMVVIELEEECATAPTEQLEDVPCIESVGEAESKVIAIIVAEVPSAEPVQQTNEAIEPNVIVSESTQSATEASNDVEVLIIAVKENEPTEEANPDVSGEKCQEASDKPTDTKDNVPCDTKRIIHRFISPYPIRKIVIVKNSVPDEEPKECDKI